MNISTLRKTSGNLDRLTKELEKINQPKNQNSGDDTRFWKPEVDKSGNGYAVIRFLPAPAADGDDSLPWVRYWDHGFQGPTGKWYIENSLTSLNGNQKDPVSELNSILWNNGTEAGKKAAQKQKRRLHYVSNIVVVEDPKNPDNNGKVFLYKYGKKIFDKITEAMNPQFADEKPINPFDFWAGAEFKLKIRNVEGYRNYDKSEFSSSTELLGGDEKKLTALYAQEHSLKTFLDPKLFKSYDELKNKLNAVLGTTGSPQTVTEEPVQTSPSRVVISNTEEDDDEDMIRFKKLADED